MGKMQIDFFSVYYISSSFIMSVIINGQMPKASDLPWPQVRLNCIKIGLLQKSVEISKESLLEL